MKKTPFLLLCSSLLLSFSLPLIAGDLDDGIKADEPIKDDLDLDVNVQYIKRRAKAAAQMAESGKPTTGKVIVNTSCSGTGNQTFGAGANLQGATIVNLSENKGTTTVCDK
jgi:hypothetical protein